MNVNIRKVVLLLAAVAVLHPGSALAARGRAIRTGQTNTRGAVGDTTAGMTRSYVDNGFGWVKDQRTGLVWEKKSQDGSIHDKDDAYTWSADGDMATGTVFTVFLAALNTPPCFAGFCDWRLPTSFELYSIVDIGFALPAAGPDFDAGCLPGCSVETCNCTNSDGYWTSSTPKSFDDLAWVVEFGSGAVILGDKSSTYRVRAVRSDRP